jgi:Putative adhesin
VTASCLSFSDVEMNVPRGATVQLQTRDGDINVADVSTAYVNTQSGDVSIQRATKAVDAGTMGGVISLKDSSGCINLHSVGGNIEASGVRPTEASDTFDARSLGGDIVLDQVAHARLNARSLNGSLSMTGRLAHDGHYDFNTISGDVTLTLPVDSSFRISAKLSQSAEVITDFPLTLKSYSSAPVRPSGKLSPPDLQSASLSTSPEALPKTPAPAALPPVDGVAPARAADPPDDPPRVIAKTKIKVPRVVVVGYPLRRLDGVCGSGDALIDVSSFSGTVHLKKQ